MPFPIEQFPHSDFHSLDVRYWLSQFEQMTNDWHDLYTNMITWKNGTIADLETWKNTQTAQLRDWEDRIETNIESFENRLTADQRLWYAEKTAELNAWKSDFETLFNTTFSNLTEIKTAAESARDEAIEAAESIENSAEQISINTNNIENLQEQTDNRWKSLTTNYSANPNDYYISGHISATNGAVNTGTNRLTNTVKINNTEILEINTNEGYGYYLYAWNGNSYIGSYRNGSFEPAANAELLTSHNIAIYPNTYNFLINLKRLDSANIDISETVNIIYVRNVLGPDTTLEKSGEAADSKTVGDKFNNTKKIIIGDFPANPNDFYISGYISGTTGAVYTGNDRLTNYNKINSNIIQKITANEGYAFYINAWDENTYIGSYRNNTFAPSSGAELITEFDLTLYPATYNYLINIRHTPTAHNISKEEAVNIIYTGSNIFNLESNISSNKKDIDKTFLAVIGLHEIPESQGVMNCIRRARQMTDIEWTPAVDLPRVCRVMGDEYNHSNTYEDVFKAGIKYKGIPYSNTLNNTNAGYRRKYLGFDVDIETFITAIENPNSVISEESFYDGTNLHSTIYGLVCSSFVSYVIGLATPKTTNTLPLTDGMTQIGKLVNNNERFDLSALKLCDIFDLPGSHGVIITDIIRNEDESIKYIEISEETIGGNGNPNNKGSQNGGLCRRRGFTPDEIYEYYGEYNIYRYSYLNNVTYTPNKFVNTGNELDLYRFYSLPCMPYMGEKAVYNTSNLIGTKILINCPGYNYLRVFKDGAEISGSPFTLSAGTADVDTHFTATGNYEAYLSKYTSNIETGTTLHCHWSVVSD